MLPIEIRFEPYRNSDLRDWKSGRYDWLEQSAAPQYLKKILIQKAKARREGKIRAGKLPDRRFFGEAFVARELGERCQEGWYGSFHWLTSPRWTTDRQSSEWSHTEFSQALGKKFRDYLPQLQMMARKLCGLPNCKAPAARDLWFVDHGTHRFIEVKLSRDKIHEPQLAGLALIGTWLSPIAPVSVEIVRLYESGPRRPKSLSRAEAEKAWAEKLYAHFCRRLEAP